MNKNILNKEVQEYINDHLNDDISRISLNKSPFDNVTSAELAEQIAGKKSAEKKLPAWTTTPGIYFPKKLSVEQSSSELTAKYKSQFVRGEKLLDLTGGFGVDDYYFSKRVKSVVHCEINKELSSVAQHNAGVLKSDNIEFITADGLDFISKTSEYFDTVYIDPSRRANHKKVFLLSDCEPDAVKNSDLIFRKTGRLILKTSPLLDIRSGLKELKFVSQVHVVSIKNDCKELLWIMDKNFQGEPEIICAMLSNDETKKFEFKTSEEKAVQLHSFSLPLQYLYEPDVSLLKAGCFKLTAERFHLQKLHPNTHLYTSDLYVKDFPGKKFKISESSSYKNFSRNIKSSKANIISRNFPLTVDEIKKKHKLKDGGESYLIFTTVGDKKLITILAGRA